MMNLSNIITTVAGALIVASLLWLAGNVVFASDLQELEHSVTQTVERVQQTVLRREVRDISREIRALEVKTMLTESEQSYQAALETDLTVAQAELDELLDDD